MSLHAHTHARCLLIVERFEVALASSLARNARFPDAAAERVCFVRALLNCRFFVLTLQCVEVCLRHEFAM